MLLYHLTEGSAIAISKDSSYMLVTGADGTADNKWITRLRVVSRDGTELWYSGKLDSTIQGPANGYAWISDDGSKMVAAAGNWLYFLTKK
jgi:WD40 repeat protein